MNNLSPHSGIPSFCKRQPLSNSRENQHRDLLTRSDSQLQREVDTFVSAVIALPLKRLLENSDSGNRFKFKRSIKDQSGLVANIFRKRSSLETQIKLVFLGLELGSISIDIPLKELWLTNSHLFGMGIDTKNQEAPLIIYEWDEAGKLVKRFEIPELDNFKNGIPRWVVASSENYLAIVIGNGKNEGQSPKILILDFITKSHRVIDLEPAGEQIDVGCAIIHRNKLVIGSSKTTFDGMDEVLEQSIPKITIFNLLTKKIENTFDAYTECGSISHLIARNMQVYFISHFEGKDVWLCSLNLVDGEQKELLELPDMDRIEGMLQLSIADDLLIVCNGNHSGRTNSMTFQRWEIKLD